MAVLGSLICKALILKQRSDRQIVDPALLAGTVPRWASSLTCLVVTLLTLPFVVWALFRMLSEERILEIGDALRRLVWTDVPLNWLYHCGSSCRDLVYGMAILPMTWSAGIVGAFLWYRISRDRLMYQNEQLRRQTKPSNRLVGIAAMVELYRTHPYRPVMFVLAVIVLHWALPRFVGDLVYLPDGRTKVFTTWRFGVLCAVLGVAMSGLGAIVFIVARILNRLDR